MRSMLCCLNPTRAPMGLETPSSMRAVAARYGGSWVRRHSAPAQHEQILRVTVNHGRAIAVWDDGALGITEPFSGTRTIPISRIRGRTIDIYCSDAAAVLRVEALDLDRAGRNVRGAAPSTATKEQAEDIIAAVQYKRQQLETMAEIKDYAGGDEGPVLTFVAVLDKWLEDHAPYWYDRQQWDKIVSTGQRAIQSVNDVLKLPAENFETLVAGIQTSFVETVDDARGVVRSSVTSVLLALGLIAVIMVFK